MTRYEILGSEGWQLPNPAQQALIRAATAEGREILPSWDDWCRLQDLNAVDMASVAMLPRLYHNLSTLEVDHPAMPRLRELYELTRRRNQVAKRVLIEVCELFSRADIPVMALKGMPLLLFYYRDSGVRPMSDVDLLIRDPDLERAADILRDAGWLDQKPFPPRELQPFIHAVSFRRPGQRTIDLHWRPFTVDCPEPAETAFWERAEIRDAGGSSILVPDAADLFIQTCFHGRKNDPHASFRWIMDALTLIREANPPLDYLALTERARELGVFLPVRDALLYLHHELAVELPGNVLDTVLGKEIGKEERARAKRLMRGIEAHGRGFSARTAEHWFRYSRASRHRGLVVGPIGFLRYVGQYYQHFWSLSSAWQLPLAGLRRVGRFGARSPSAEKPRST